MGSQQQNSGKTRTKRAAIPNNPTIRKQLRKIAADKKEGMTFAKRKEIRMANSKKSQKNPTDFGKAGMELKAEKKGPLEIRYRALAKKMRQIEELEKKKKEGTTPLDRWQISKLHKKLFLQEEIKALVSAGAGGGEEGAEGGEDG
eukprot:CAMPEP_0197614648 /NCGR_PEP_ID=MMETSP1326-20131121/59609_1 /TAXON_ID=1155430 /ORGANISM="Genus nov. species nov., Strain RCC2288" /LENGTH=144 /DNA_ID=CAMNT_0043183523 /DNA_START=233 /DNA_END=664 /DNA_ORIENTATION=-